MSEFDSFKTNIFSDIPYGVYLYFLDASKMSNDYGDFDNVIPLTHANSILSIQSTPYIQSEDLILDEIPYDLDRYKYLENGGALGYDDGAMPKVYRIKNMKGDNKPKIKTKEIGEFACYYQQPPLQNERDWRNESKLYNYPYRFAYLFDGICQPWEIRYHNCKKNINKVKVKIALNMNADYKLLIENYKEDFDGFMEGWQVGTNKELPCISNTYLNWLATNKNQMETTISNSTFNTFSQGVMGMIGNGLSGNIMGVLGSGFQATANTIINKEMMTRQQIAQQRDMMNAPNKLISKGGDFILGIGETENHLKLIRYRQPDYVMEKIGTYFAMYGYKQNKMMNIEKRSRYYYNYIKTIGINLETYGIPKNHVDILKSIYDKGVTIWHIDREGVRVGDYSKDNREV